MDILLQDNLFSHPIFYSLALTLLHFLWQGGLIALALKLSLIFTSHKNPQLRYAFSSLAMLACLIAPIITFFILYQPTVISTENNSNHLLTLLSQSNENLPRVNVVNITTDLLPYISIAWLAVVMFLSSKLVIEVYLVNQLPNQATTPAPTDLNNRFAELVDQMKLPRTPKLLISLTVDVPMAIGWLKPVVLVPASMLSGLTPLQLEMLILHELAHIRRHDYLVNFLQTIVAILLFFHPAVQWISKQMRNEREYCSDDIAVKHCGNAIAYAHTLADTAALCSKHRHHTIPNMAMAASGGDLKNRVVRLVDHHCTPSNDIGKWLAASTILIVIASITAQQMLMPNLFEVGKSTTMSASKESNYSKKAPLAESSLANQLLANATIETGVSSPVLSKNMEKLNEQKNSIVELIFVNIDNNLKNISSNSANSSINFDQMTLAADAKLVNNTAQPHILQVELTQPLIDNVSVENTPVIYRVPEVQQNTLFVKSVEIKNVENKDSINPDTERVIKIVEAAQDIKQTHLIDKPAIASLAQTSNDMTKSSDKVSTEITAKLLAQPSSNSDMILASNDTGLFKKVSQSSIELSSSLANEHLLDLNEKQESGLFTQSSSQITNHSAFDNDFIYGYNKEEKPNFPQEEKAELIFAVDPKYPTTAKRKGLELEIQVNFTIDKNGDIKDIEFEKQSKINYFRSSIRNAMKQWAFQPATVDGQPVESQMSKIFSFSLTS